MNKSKKFSDIVTDFLGKLGATISNQRHLSAIRDAFATFVPLLIAGSFAVLINSVFVSPYGLVADLFNVSGQSLENWESVAFYLLPIFEGIAFATVDTYAFFIAFFLGYFLSGSYGHNKMFGGALAFSSFLLMRPISASSYQAWSTYFLGTDGLLLAMMVGLITPMIFNFFSNLKKIKIKMPESVPEAIASSFNELFPVILTLFVIGLIQPLWGAISFSSGIGGYTLSDGTRVITENYYLIAAINSAIAQPLLELGNSLFFVILIHFLFSFFFFFGIHGPNILTPVISPLWDTANLYNVNLYNKYGLEALNSEYILSLGLDPLFTWTRATTDAFTILGGTGCTLGLLILISLLSKNKISQKTTQISFVPGLFNINEPVTFGLPIMLNFIWFIPYVLAQTLVVIPTYIFTSLGVINPTLTFVPWTTPIFLNGFLATLDLFSFLLTFINLFIVITIYLPFVIFANKIDKKKPKDQLEENTIIKNIWIKITKKLK